MISNTRVSPHFSLEPYFLLFLFLSSCHKILHIFSWFCLLLGFYENNEWLWNCAGISCPTCWGHLHLPGQSSTSHWASGWAVLLAAQILVIAICGCSCRWNNKMQGKGLNATMVGLGCILGWSNSSSTRHVWHVCHSFGKECRICSSM